MQTDVLDGLLYADDMDKNASPEATMQRAVDQVSQLCDNYDFTISTQYTEAVHQPAPGKPYNELTITVNGQKLKVVDKFTYLEAVSPEQCTLMLRSLPELQTQVWHSEDSGQMYGSEMESSLTPS